MAAVTVLLITSKKKRNFSQAQYKVPEDGPVGPKHVAANVGHFNVNFNISLCLIKGTFVGKEEFHVIKMNGTTIKKILHPY